MKKSELKQIIKEEIEKTLNQKYQITFIDSDGDEEVVKQLFNSEEEAREWAESFEWDTQEEIYIGGDYRYITKYYYYNPETKYGLNKSYEINKVK
jgi:hypothetical protein